MRASSLYHATQGLVPECLQQLNGVQLLPVLIKATRRYPQYVVIRGKQLTPTKHFDHIPSTSQTTCSEQINLTCYFSYKMSYKN